MYTYSVLKTHMVKHSSNRRSFMKASGTAGVALSIGVTGCLGEDTPTPDSDDDDGNGTSANGNGVTEGPTVSLWGSLIILLFRTVSHSPLVWRRVFEDNGVSVDDIVSTDGVVVEFGRSRRGHRGRYVTSERNGASVQPGSTASHCRYGNSRSGHRLPDTRRLGHRRDPGRGNDCCN
ncbi:twin-arginine translocation signal domain-containing protein [Natrialba swarupiae]|nr:twin-arginine translocation signal domain-containing protein [Natrialba swarupiae]